jgi:hypothetical protein
MALSSSPASVSYLVYDTALEEAIPNVRGLADPSLESKSKPADGRRPITLAEFVDTLPQILRRQKEQPGAFLQRGTEDKQQPNTVEKKRVGMVFSQNVVSISVGNDPKRNQSHGFGNTGKQSMMQMKRRGSCRELSYHTALQCMIMAGDGALFWKIGGLWKIICSYLFVSKNRE